MKRISTLNLALSLIALMVFTACAPSSEKTSEELASPTETPMHSSPTAIIPSATATPSPGPTTATPGITVLPSEPRDIVEREYLEPLLAEIDFSSLLPNSFVVSPDKRRIAYVALVGDKIGVYVNDEEGKPYDYIAQFRFSPNNQRFAYLAETDGQWLIVVDENEEKTYPYIDSLVFSPDSHWVTYGAIVEDLWVVVVNGNEGKSYDEIVTFDGGIVFDSPDTLH